MLNIIAFKNGIAKRNVPRGGLKSFMKGKNMVWIDVEDGNNEEFDFIAKTFNIHPLTIEDMKFKNILPKMDALQDRYMFIGFQTMRYDKISKKIKTKELDFCIGKKFLITVHSVPIGNVSEYREKILSNTSKSIFGPDNVMHSLMDIEVDGFTKLVDDMDDEVEEFEGRLVRGDTENTLQRLSDHRRQVYGLKKIVFPERDIINKLSRGESPYISKNMLFYFRDIYDHMFRFHLNLDAHRELIASTFETYSSMQSNSINQVTKQLTIIATIFLPLTFITGIYGMNFQFMPELVLKYGYFYILAAMFVTGMGMWLYFRKKKY